MDRPAIQEITGDVLTGESWESIVDTRYSIQKGIHPIFETLGSCQWPRKSDMSSNVLQFVLKYFF